MIRPNGGLPPYSPDLVPTDFWLLPKLKKCVLKGKRFSDIEDTKSSVKIFRQILLFRILKAVLNNSRSAGNDVKN
jgi:hypothetical protein